MTGVGALLIVSTSACGSVEVRDPDASAAERTACTELVDALPDRVADQSQRETRGSPLGAAWGDPAIVLRCGVDRPDDYDPLDGCQTVNGVDWYAPEEAATDQGADAVLTTLGREPAVELLVPADLRPPAAALVDIANAVKEHSREVRPCT